MSDIVERLRKWCHAVNAASAQDLMDEAAAEIERLQEIVAGYTEGISAANEAKQSYGQTDEGRMNTNTIRLTDAEQDAVERAAFALNGGEDWSPDVGTKDKQACVTLRNLLERLK
jgi:hypothetical protein